MKRHIDINDYTWVSTEDGNWWELWRAQAGFGAGPVCTATFMASEADAIARARQYTHHDASEMDNALDKHIARRLGEGA